MKQDNKVYTAAVLVIGNEILSGRTQDTNTNTIAKALSEKGVRLMEARVVPDIKDRIIETVNDLRTRYDYVLSTGGIGPTHDDITADCMAAAFGVSIDVRQDAYEILLRHYGKEDLTDARLRMARIPQGAELIPNPVSAAPGFRLGNVYIMAGVPQIMRGMLDHVVSGLNGGHSILSASLSCALPESALADAMGALQKKYPEIEVGSYPHFRGGAHGLSIAVRGINKDMLKAAILEMAGIVKDLGGAPELTFPL